MIFCNPVPIAMSCHVGKNVVVSAHKAFFRAICHLTQLGNQSFVKIDYVRPQYVY